MNCTECGLDKAPDAFNSGCNAPTVCFKCRVSSVNLGFNGYQDFFHDDTIKAFQTKQIADGRANGLEPQLKTNHGAGLVGSQMTKLEEHHKNRPTKKAI